MYEIYEKKYVKVLNILTISLNYSALTFKLDLYRNIAYKDLILTNIKFRTL